MGVGAELNKALCLGNYGDTKSTAAIVDKSVWLARQNKATVHFVVRVKKRDTYGKRKKTAAKNKNRLPSENVEMPDSC